MTESNARPPRRIGGSLAFISAHNILEHQAIPFEYAYVLTRLVLEELGGPVPFTGKEAKIAKPIVTALTHLGYIEQIAWTEFTQKWYIELTLDGRISELLDAKYAGIKIRPDYAIPRYKWLARATQAAFDLVAENLP